MWENETDLINQKFFNSSSQGAKPIIHSKHYYFIFCFSVEEGSMHQDQGEGVRGKFTPLKKNYTISSQKNYTITPIKKNTLI